MSSETTAPAASAWDGDAARATELAVSIQRQASSASSGAADLGDNEEEKVDNSDDDDDNNRGRRVSEEEGSERHGAGDVIASSRRYRHIEAKVHMIYGPIIEKE